MKIHFNQINSIHHRGVHNKNQITEERYESKGSRTVLKGRWETVMSPIDPNKWAIEQLASIAPVIKKFGWQTSNLRKHLGLEKQQHSKGDAIAATHAVDGIALAASQFIDYLAFENSEGHGYYWQGEITLTDAPFFVIRRPPISRRQLHLMVFSQGGNRRKYGGTNTRHGIRKGDYVVAERKGIKYYGWCSGDTKTQVSVSDRNWKRLGQFSKNKVQLLRRSTGLICKQLIEGANFSRP